MTDARGAPLGRAFLYVLVLLGAYLSYLILSPFLAAIIWAVLFAVLFHGMQTGLTARIGAGRAALVITLIVGVAIVAPAVVLISALVREVPQVSDSVARMSEGAPRQIRELWGAVRSRSPVPVPEDPTELLAEGTRRLLAFIVPRAGAFVADLLGLFGTLAALLFALFFMLRDGEAMVRYVRDRLPLAPEDSERLMAETRDLVMASFGAGLTVAVAQGLLGGVAFLLVGISAPVFWGIVIGFFSLLPVVGAATVWVPAALGLLLSGEIGRGAVLIVLGVLGISMADNVLRPFLLSGRTAISGLVIFFGLLGGVAAFGFVGLVIGPIVLVTTARLFEYLRRSDLTVHT